MNRTKTIFIDLQRLQAVGDSASTIIRLMMACNDIALANQCFTKFKEEQAPIRKHVQQGALMYFVRLEFAHFHEGMEIIKEIKRNPNLQKRIEHCSQTAKDSFNYIDKEFKSNKTKNFFKDIRNKNTFHYDNDIVVEALKDRVSRKEANRSKVTKGTHISLFRFELADDIHNTLVCHQICKISSDANQSDMDEIMLWASKLCKAFLDFGEEFAYSYLLDYAAMR